MPQPTSFRFRSRRACLKALMISCAMPGLAQAQADVPRDRIDVAAGDDGATRTGRLKGPDTDVMDYVVSLSAGQRLTVALSSSNPKATAFNVLSPAAGEALYRGELEGKAQWSGLAPDAGEYVVRVFLNRAFARRGAAAMFTLKVTVR